MGLGEKAKISNRSYFSFFDINRNEGTGMKTCSSSFICCPHENCKHLHATFVCFSRRYLSTRSWHGHSAHPPTPTHPDLCVGPCKQTAQTEFSTLVLRTGGTAVILKNTNQERLNTHLLLIHVPYPYCMETDYQNLFKHFSSDHYKYHHHIYQ